MRTIWEKVMTARGTMAGLRQQVAVPKDETPEEANQRLLVRIRNFGQALGELKDAIFNHSPFISETLYHELFNHLLLAAQAEHLNIRVHRPTEPDWFEVGEKNLANFIPKRR